MIRAALLSKHPIIWESRKAQCETAQNNTSKIVIQITMEAKNDMTQVTAVTRSVVPKI